MVIIFFLVSIIILHCNYNSSAESVSDHEKYNSLNEEKRTLLHDLSGNGALLIYGIDDLADSTKFLQEINSLKRFYWFPKVAVKRSDEVSKNELASSAIILIGSYKSNKILQTIENKLPVNFQSNSFSFKNKNYDSKDETIFLLSRNPFNNNKILILFSGNSNDYIFSNLSFDFIGDISISKSGERELFGFLKYDDDKNWIIDNSSVKDFSKNRHELNFSPYYNYIIHSDKYDINAIKKESQKTDSLFDSAKRFFNKTANASKRSLHIYESFEDKGLITGSTELNNINSKDFSIHVVLNDYINGNDFSMNALLLARQYLGETKTKFLEVGLSTYLSDNWRGKGYEYWASKIFLSGNIPPLKDLLSNDELEFISYLIYQPLAGSFTAFLIKKYSKDYFLSNYSNWDFNSENIKQLEIEWHAYLSKLASNYKSQIEKDNWIDELKLPSFQKGFCFAHVGYQIYNGYASQKAVESLKKIKELGANTFSITPFTYMRDPNKPVKYKYWEFAGGESIESMIHLMHASQKLNLTVMLKPHIYLGESNWPGVIEMQSESDWKFFFSYYERWIMHYAVFAEMYHVPLFVIGNELSKTTIGHEHNWIELANKIKNIYKGKIIYASNWGDEFEKLTFWNHFDYIGLSQYYPLSSKDNPTDDELLTGADSVINRINAIHKKYNKPVIFTETGFRASKAPWKTALEKDGRNEVHLNNQARCYEALFKAIKNEKWLMGIYWWKWPSYLEYKGFTFGEGYDLYAPNNDETEKVIEKFFYK